MENILVGLLTEEQKNLLLGVQYIEDVYYNPVLDADDNWIISTYEMDNTTNESYLWVKDLPLIIFNPVDPLGPFANL